MKKPRVWLSAAFSAIAALGLYAGISHQRATATPVSKTAFSYAADNKGTVNGKVGTDKAGLEYIVEDLNRPRVKVAAKISDFTAAAEHDSKAKKTGFYAQAKLGNKSGLAGKVYFDDRKKTESASVRYDRAFGSWLENAAFTYTQSLGKKPDRDVKASLGFSILGKKIEWAPSYDLRNSTLNFGYLRFL